MKIISIIKDGKRYDMPAPGLDKLPLIPLPFNKGLPTAMLKYGTSEGAKAGWDARGRGKKGEGDSPSEAKVNDLTQDYQMGHINRKEYEQKVKEIKEQSAGTEEKFSVGETVTKLPNAVEMIMAHEGEGLSDKDTIRLYSHLVSNGQAWSLQGHYGRMASSLINAGYLDDKGKILKDPDMEAEKMLKYGTSEGAIAGWDTRGRKTHDELKDDLKAGNITGKDYKERSLGPRSREAISSASNSLKRWEGIRSEYGANSEHARDAIRGGGANALQFNIKVSGGGADLPASVIQHAETKDSQVVDEIYWQHHSDKTGELIDQIKKEIPEVGEIGVAGRSGGWLVVDVPDKVSELEDQANAVKTIKEYQTHADVKVLKDLATSSDKLADGVERIPEMIKEKIKELKADLGSEKWWKEKLDI